MWFRSSFFTLIKETDVHTVLESMLKALCSVFLFFFLILWPMHHKTISFNVSHIIAFRIIIKIYSFIIH